MIDLLTQDLTSLIGNFGVSLPDVPSVVAEDLHLMQRKSRYDMMTDNVFSPNVALEHQHKVHDLQITNES